MKLYKNMLKSAGIAIGKLYFHMNMNILASHVDITSINEKNELSKIQRKKINFINRLKYAEQKIFCICIDSYKIYEGNDYDQIYKVLSILKNKKLKINNKLIEIYKELLLNPNFEQNKYSLTSKGI